MANIVIFLEHRRLSRGKFRGKRLILFLLVARPSRVLDSKINRNLSGPLGGKIYRLLPDVYCSSRISQGVLHAEDDEREACTLPYMTHKTVFALAVLTVRVHTRLRRTHNVSSRHRSRKLHFTSDSKLIFSRRTRLKRLSVAKHKQQRQKENKKGRLGRHGIAIHQETRNLSHVFSHCTYLVWCV